MVKYVEIYETLKERILDREYEPNSRLPDGTALSNEFSCSEFTIKKALDILVSDGLVVRKRGSGTYVKLPLGSQAHRHLYGAKANLAQSNRALSTRLLSYTIEPATDFLAKRLNCDIDDMLHHIVRVRFADGKPIVIEDTFMPITTITGLSREKVKGSIYDHINHDLGLKIHSATIEITAPSASSLESEHLNIPLGNSLINVEQVAYLDNGEAFEYSNVKYPCHEFRFTTNYIKL